MLVTYKAILKNDRLEWRGPAPSQLAPGKPVSVHVTILDESFALSVDVSRGQQMAAALEQLAAANAFAGLADPAAWEREVRQDRALPGREPDDAD
ncbi:MAG: hypothetical protein JW934_11665 [Anaerolineae bacterium]|nr:hypothetical protein [Anaerolineae bacterium]